MEKDVYKKNMVFVLLSMVSVVPFSDETKFEF